MQKHAIHCNKGAGKLGASKVDILVVAVFIKVLCPVKCMFLLEQGLCNIISSDVLLLKLVCSDPNGSVAQLVIFNMIVASATHLDKIALCLGAEMCVKGKNKLPG